MSSRLWSAGVVICKRQVLVAVRSPFATFIELIYPSLAAAVLLMLRNAANQGPPTLIMTNGDAASGAEYICWSVIWATVFLSSNLKFVQNVMEEKENKEFIQVYGASEISYWLGNYMFIALFAVLQSLLVSVITVSYLGDYSATIVKLFLLIVCFEVSCVSTGMLATSFTDSARASLFIYGTLYIVMLVPYLKSVRDVIHDPYETNTVSAWSMFMSPQASLVCGIDQLLGGFVNADKFSNPGSAKYPVSACSQSQAVLYLLFLLDGIIYAALGWYFHQVRPGQLGIAKRWNFLFQSTYWQHQTAQYRPRRKIWAEAQVFVPQQNYSDLFENVCNTCQTATQQHLGHHSPALPRSKTSTGDRLVSGVAKTGSPLPKEVAPSQPIQSAVTTVGDGLAIEPAATPLPLFNAAYRGVTHYPLTSATTRPLTYGGMSCSCKPLIVVDQVHKIYTRKRLTWQRFKNWIKRKLDLGVVKPPTGRHVLKGISFKVFEGQVIVIMGRNGSGTSTLLSIIGGLQDCSSGNVFVAGHDIHRQVVAARKRIGYCPQTNFFLEKMTIGEQLSFAATLKGVPRHIAKCDIEVILKMLELHDKIDWLPHRLSQGEKKRLAIGMALLGNPRCIVIDDLSTGLDVLSRRVIWRTLAEMKHNRAIIVSTHCPNEAQYIADKIGVLESGCMKAFGSPIFLKSRFEDGYILSVQDNGKRSDNLAHHIIELLHAFSTDACIINPYGVELTFRIPYKAQRHIPLILQILEKKQNRWGFRHVQLTTTRLEQVLERIWDDTAADAERRKARYQASPDVATLTSYIGQMHGGDEEPASGDIVPSSTVNPELSDEFMEWSAKSELTSHLSSLACTVDTCEWSENEYVVRVSGYIGNPSVFTEARIKWHLARTAWNHMARNLLSVFWKRLHMMRKDGWLLYIQLFLPPLVAVVFSATWLFSPRYAEVPRPPVLSDDLDYICAGHGVPSEAFISKPIAWTLVMKAVFSVMAIELIPSVWGNYVTSERASGNKIHQHAAGIPMWLYWLGELAWDFTVFLITGGLSIIAMAITRSPLLTTGTWYWLLLALFLYAVSAAAGTFFLSFIFQSGTTIQVVMMSGGVLIPFLVGALHAVGPQGNSHYLTYIFLLVPHSAFAQVCYSLVFDCSCGPSAKKCPQHFLTFEMNGWPFLYMATECVVYFAAVIFLDAIKHDPHMRSLSKRFRCFDPAALRRKLKRDGNTSRHLPFPALHRLFNKGVEVENSLHIGDLFGTEQERVRVKQAVAQFKEDPGEVTHPVLVAENISKWKVSSHLGAVKASNCFGRRRYIICDRASFIVNEEELLGFVGLNGSGMSSIMNMLSGNTHPTEGTLWINGIDLQYDPHARWSRMGFCSESDTVLEGRLTGREILEMFGRIGLIDREYLRRTVIPEALAMVCLKDMKNKPVDSYSQGDKRKLSFILSLLTGARILLLDSPTLGMDITSRRRIWNVINHLKLQQHKTIIVASSSPDECEMLSDRIACVKAGRIVAIGNVANVKAHLASCYELILNVYAASALDKPVYYNGELISETPCLLYTRFLETIRISFPRADLVEILGTWARFIIPAESTIEPRLEPLPNISLKSSFASSCLSSTQRRRNSESGGRRFRSESYGSRRARRRGYDTATAANDIRDAYAMIQQKEVFHRAVPPPSPKSENDPPENSNAADVNRLRQVIVDSEYSDTYSFVSPLSPHPRMDKRVNSAASSFSPRRRLANEKELLVAQDSAALWNQQIARQMSNLLIMSPRRVTNSSLVNGYTGHYLDEGSMTISEVMSSPRHRPCLIDPLPIRRSSSLSSSFETAEPAAITMSAIYRWLNSHKVSERSLVRRLGGVSSYGDALGAS